MNYLPNSFISHLKLITFYKDFFSIKKLLKEFPNIVLRSSSFPLTINFLISEQCNFFCNMCSWRGSDHIQRTDNKGNLNIVDIQKFISRIKIHQPTIHIGGGEPFMHRNLLDIVTIIKNNKLKCLITTNGSLMDECIIEKVVKLKTDALIFSLYGLEDIHDAITRVKGSFKKVIANLRSVLSKRTKYTKVFVSTLPLPENIMGLKELIRNLYTLGVDRIKIEQLNFLTLKEYEQSINNRGNFNLNPSTFIRDNYFDEEFIIDLINIYKDIHRTFKNFVYVKPYLNETQLINWYASAPYRFPRCFFINHSVFINYNGDIVPCQSFPNCVVGNITDDSLESVWHSYKYKVLRKNISLIRPITCLRCCKN